jgi:ABC-type transport system involved in multi-copper enzyme maturation permease subunit
VNPQISRLILVVGFVVVAAILVVTRAAWLSAVSHGFPSVWRIAKMTVAEARRKRVLQAVVILVILIMLSLTIFSNLSPHEQSRMIIDSGLTTIAGFGMLLAIFLGAFMVPAEIESRTIYPIMAKPVRRFEFILGKYLGAMIILAVICAIMLVVLIGVLAFQHRIVQDLPDNKFDPNFVGVIIAAVMSYLALAVLTSLIILISAVSSTTMTIIGALLLWAVGSMQNMLLDLSEKTVGATKVLTWALLHVVPPLQDFDLRSTVSNYMRLDLAGTLSAVGDGALYTIVALLLAAIFFDNRQV